MTDTEQRIRTRRPPQPSWSRREVDALLRVSGAAALAADPRDVLHVIAAEACAVTGAMSASILLIQPGPELSLAASHNLSADYSQFLRGHWVSHGRTPSRAAAEQLEPVIVEDIATHRGASLWRRYADREGFRAMLAVPLRVGNRSSGVLNLYRADPGPWASSAVELALTFAQHAASAIESAKLIDSQRRQVEALDGLVGVLRDQTDEYANRLQSLSGLMELDEHGEAERFLAQLMTLHHENYSSVIERIHHPVLAGLLVAQMSVARQRGVEVRLDRRTHLESLPSALGSTEAVTIVSNLVQNAIEAVARMPPDRRRASVRITQSRKAVTIAVRDWGPGLDPGPGRDVWAKGTSSKEGHAGIGLALVSEAVASARGTIRVEPAARGTSFVVTLPSDRAVSPPS